MRSAQHGRNTAAPLSPARGELRKDLSWIENAGGIEGGLDALHQRNLFRRQLDRQIRRLREPDSVFATDGPFERHYAFEKLTLRLTGTSQLVIVGPVDHQVHVDIAIARVAEGRDAQPVLPSEISDSIKQLRH